MSWKQIKSIMLVFFVSLLISCICANSEENEQRKIIDLTYTYNDKYTPSHPKDSSFDLRLVKKGKIKPGIW